MLSELFKSPRILGKLDAEVIAEGAGVVDVEDTAEEEPIVFHNFLILGKLELVPLLLAVAVLVGCDSGKA
jgi:hypothetical protein